VICRRGQYPILRRKFGPWHGICIMDIAPSSDAIVAVLLTIRLTKRGSTMTTQITRRSMLKRTCGIALGGAAAAATGLSLKDAVAQPVTGSGIPVTATDFTGMLTARMT
jgi:hypothetical protein